MNKKEFSEALHRLLSDLPWTDVVSSVEFYEEMIEDRLEEGLSEEEAISQIGTPEEIAARIRSEFPVVPVSAEPEGEEKKRSLGTWILLLVGSPLWLSLLIAVVAVGIALLAVAVSLLVSLWSVVIALGGASLLWLVAAGVSVFQHNLLSGGMLCGLSLFGAGLCILSFFLCRFLTKKAFDWMKKGVKKGIAWVRERREKK